MANTRLEPRTPGAVQCPVVTHVRFVGWVRVPTFQQPRKVGTPSLRPFLAYAAGPHGVCRLQEWTHTAMEEQATLERQTSSEFVGRWNHLVSTTNWEKGRIICQWRGALQAADASQLAYTDDAWSQQVGGVSPQHVGRLRRVFERFGDVHDQYTGLFWSHFYAALDWHDAEMYLEGAVQNGWSVSEMRRTRSEAIGVSPELIPSDADVAIDADEDILENGAGQLPAAIAETFGEVRNAARRDDDLAGEPDEAADYQSADMEVATDDAPSAVPSRPFESLPALPPDMNDAFELMKLAILNHKVSGWREIARSDVLAVLESLRQLTVAATE